MVKIKICGLKNSQDVHTINKFEIDYAGFILAESKREISHDNLEKLLKQLKGETIPVGVFVNADFLKIQDAVSKGIGVIQLHGDEDYEYIRKLRNKLNNESIEIWKAIRVKDTEPDESLFLKNADRYLFDKYISNVYGGTGEKFEWNLVAEKSKKYSIILAGGINPVNVSSAVMKVNPYCIDVSSGVETQGYKDEIKIKALIRSLGKKT